MAEKKSDAKPTDAGAADNLGQSGTDTIPTYQDEAGLTAADKPAVVEINHGEESPAAKAEREAMEKDPPSPVPAQMLPENQDESAK